MFYGNPDTDQIVKSIRKSTSAYYELGIQLKDLENQDIRMSVKSKRPGVYLHSVRYSEPKKPYEKMEKLQREAIAMDIAADGMWRRVLKDIRTAEYRNIDIRKRKKQDYYKIEIDIPEELRDKKLDFFVMRFNDDLSEADVKHKEKVAGDYEILELKTKKEKRQLYFVIIDPETTTVLLNQIGN